MCPSCKDLNIEFQIRFPSDLRKAIVVTRNNLADGTIPDITEGDGMPFHELVSSSQWEDALLYYFQCNTCGQLFRLYAETYHGRGGRWKPTDKITLLHNLKIVMKNIAFLL